MTDRTPTDFALEHAEYMAKDAERLLEALSEYAAAHMALEEGDYDSEDDITPLNDRCEKADEAFAEHMAHMRSGIYEFRKRRDRALATPTPAQPDPLHVANERGEGWQPIESVPGTPEPVLLWTRAGAVRVETGWYAKNLLDESKEDDFECVFTHWRQQLAGPASPTPEPDHG